MTKILICTFVIALPFCLIIIAITIKGLRDMKRAKADPVLLRTGNKIYFFDEGLRCARVVMNFRQDERLLIRTIGRNKERLTIDYSQVLEIKAMKKYKGKILRIIQAVNQFYGWDILATSRGDRPSREEHQYRMIAYHFLYLQGLTQVDIGKLFNRNKATVCTTLQNFDNEMNYDDFRSKYDSIFSLLNENNVILQNASHL